MVVTVNLSLFKLTYLGGTVTTDGVKCAGSAQAAVLAYTRPCNISQLRRFLGLINYYSRFIRGASQLVAPLTRLTTGAHAKISRRQRAINLTASASTMAGWDDECEKSFKTLKARLVDPELLYHPDYSKPFILTTDASDIAAAAVLSQLGDDGFEHPVGYYGHVFDETECRYSATKREAFAIKWACQKLRHFLHGRLFTVITDHQALRHLETARDKTLQSWALELQDLQYVIVHRPGKDIPHVDAFSRCFPEPDPVTDSLASDVATLTMDVDTPEPFAPPSLVASLQAQEPFPVYSANRRLGSQLDKTRELQETDPVIEPLVHLLESGATPLPNSVATNCCHIMGVTLLILLTAWFILNANLALARACLRCVFSFSPRLYALSSCIFSMLTSLLGTWVLTRLMSACLLPIGGPTCTRTFALIFARATFAARLMAPCSSTMALSSPLLLLDPLKLWPLTSYYYRKHFALGTSMPLLLSTFLPASSKLAPSHLRTLVPSLAGLHVILLPVMVRPRSSSPIRALNLSAMTSGRFVTTLVFAGLSQPLRILKPMAWSSAPTVRSSVF